MQDSKSLFGAAGRETSTVRKQGEMTASFLQLSLLSPHFYKPEIITPTIKMGLPPLINVIKIIPHVHSNTDTPNDSRLCQIGN